MLFQGVILLGKNKMEMCNFFLKMLPQYSLIFLNVYKLESIMRGQRMCSQQEDYSIVVQFGRL